MKIIQELTILHSVPGIGEVQLTSHRLNKPHGINVTSFPITTSHVIYMTNTY